MASINIKPFAENSVSWKKLIQFLLACFGCTFKENCKNKSAQVIWLVTSHSKVEEFKVKVP
jgi:hypothetical protein